MKKRIILCAVLMLFLTETSLLYADLQRVQLTIHANVNPTLNNSNLASLYDNVTTHEGDLIIDGTETYVVENATYFVNGNIIVKDNAELLIENSRLVLNVSSLNEFAFYLYDSAVIDAENSTLDRGAPAMPHTLLQVCGDMSTLRMLNTTCYLGINSISHGNITINSSGIEDTVYWHASACSRISIIDSNVQGEFTITYPGQLGGTFDVVGLKPNEDVNIEVPGDSFLKVINSYVKSWSVQLELDPNYEESHLIVENSTIMGIYLTFYEDSEVKIEDLKAGFLSYWDLREEGELENVKHNLTIVNSFVTYFKLINYGKAEFDDVRDVQVATWGNASVIVENSAVTWCLNMRGMKDYALLKDSIITENWACFMDGRYGGNVGGRGGDVHYVEFENTTVNSTLYICTTYTYIKGDVTFLGGANYVWGTVEREYSVDIKDTDGNPLPNASLNLFDPDGNSVWNGTTDQEGRALFNITFSNENYKETWTLTTRVHNGSLSSSVGFLTSTPILFSMPGKKEAEDAISYAEQVLGWARGIRKAQDMDEAEELLNTARNEYSNGSYDEAFEIAQEITDLVGIKIDGSASDWEGIPPLATDPKGDALSEYGDLKSLYALMDHKFLYLLIQLYDEQPPTCFVFTMIDTNLDGQWDYIVDAWGVNEWEPTRFRVVEGDNVIIMPYADYPIETAYGNGTVEMRIPLEYLNNSSEIQLLVVTGDRTVQTIDQIGTVDCTVKACIHDVVVIPYSKVIPKSTSSIIYVAAKNLGDFDETFNVTLYANTTTIGTQTVNLSKGSSTNLTFNWNTTGLDYGNYNMTAYAWPVPGQTDMADNNMTSWITVTIPGDLNGDFKVGLTDLVILAQAYNSKPGDSNWNPNADIDGNGVVGLSDLVILAKNYGQHYP